MVGSLTGIQLGDYLVGAQIDVGGMGTIYHAEKPGSHKPLAVKVLLPEYSKDAHFRKRFEREIALLQSLKHPHIIPVYDFGQQDDLFYFVMPFIRGLSLSNLLEKEQFAPATAWMILEPIAKALTFAHQQNVIHRDLKSANILIERGASQINTHPYLADFGLSKPIDRSVMTQAGAVIGTPKYMAPEQVLGRDVTPSTDVYALGIVVYEMLLGRVPFPSGDSLQIATQQVQAAPPAPSDLRPDFPIELECVILQALEKDPSRRYETAEAFSADYWDAMQGIPLQARMTHYWVK